MSEMEGSRMAGAREEPFGVMAVLGSLGTSRPRVEYVALAVVVFGAASYIAAWGIAAAEAEAIVGVPLEEVRFAASVFDVVRGAACVAALVAAAWVMNIAGQARATLLVICGLVALLHLIAFATTGRASAFSLGLWVTAAGGIGVIMAGRDALCEAAGIRLVLRRRPIGAKAGVPARETASRLVAWVSRSLQYVVVMWAILFVAADAVRLRADVGPKVTVSLREAGPQRYRADGTREARGPGSVSGHLLRSDSRGVYIGQTWSSGGIWYPRSNVEDVHWSTR